MVLKRSNKLAIACMGLLFGASISFSDYLIDNFDDNNNTNEIGTYWYFYDDSDPGGSSVVNNDPFEDGGVEEGVAFMDFALGDSVEKTDYTLYPFVGMGFNFVDGKTEEFDLTGATAISFKAKADQEMSVKFLLETSDAVGNDDKLHHIFTVEEAWKTVTIQLEMDPDVGLTQEGWGDEIDYDPTTAQKIAFQVRGNENKKLKSGILYIDSMVLVGKPKIKKYGELDPVELGSFKEKGLIADFEGKVPFVNKLKGEWYNYDDSKLEGGTSAITKGVQEGDLVISEKGGVEESAGIDVSFLLGDFIENGEDVVAPFCGVGTNIIKGGKSYNADKYGATGVYFEYKSDVYVTLEVEDTIKRSYSAVHFAILPPTDGEWLGAEVPFDSLVLPKYASSAKPLALTNLTKIQFKLSDAPEIEGNFALDNVYLMNAEIVGIKHTSLNSAQKGIILNQSKNALSINLDKKLGESQISLINPIGKVVALKNLSANTRTYSLPLGKNASGVYLLKITSANGQVSTSPLQIIR